MNEPAPDIQEDIKLSPELNVAAEPSILGPFLGHVTDSTIRIWLYYESVQEPDHLYVTIHEALAAAPIANGTFTFTHERLRADCVQIENLHPDMRYFYQIWHDPEYQNPLDLQGLRPEDLHFHTLPDPTADAGQIDFLLMSCHNPFKALDDGYEGHAVWAHMPQMLNEANNKKVRLALMIGDQVYADEGGMEKKLLAATDVEKCQKLYLGIYKKFWSNIHYRRVLCSLPAVMMWDDHDITDGWGSRDDPEVLGKSSFVDKSSSTFKPEWLNLFQAARNVFRHMQASRNPPPLSAEYADGFDTCFRIGRTGFILMDLRSNRNVREKRIITPKQLENVQQWMAQNRQEFDTVFFASSVVFSHGAPNIDQPMGFLWPLVIKLFEWLAKKSTWGKGANAKFNESLGDIRDDLDDSWGAEINGAQTDSVLDFLFGVQNDPGHPIDVIILSGDIHASGYATLYSSNPSHAARPTLSHITSSPVSYAPFNWITEAVYRKATKSVLLGRKGIYSSQVSHHFCNRSAAVLSLRTLSPEERQLKVKYYLEGFPEPQTMLFDLNRNSHRENIQWQ